MQGSKDHGYRDQDHTSGTRTTHQGPGPHIRDQDHTSEIRTTHQGPGPHIRDQDHTSGTRTTHQGPGPHIRDQDHTSGTRTTHQGPGPHIRDQDHTSGTRTTHSLCGCRQVGVGCVEVMEPPFNLTIHLCEVVFGVRCGHIYVVEVVGGGAPFCLRPINYALDLLSGSSYVYNSISNLKLVLPFLPSFGLVLIYKPLARYSPQQGVSTINLS